MLVIAEYLVALAVGYLIVAVIASKQFNHSLWPFKAKAQSPSGNITSNSGKLPGDGPKPDAP